MHCLFEWDDAVAAERFRVEQARFIIRNITVEEVGEPEIRVYSSTGRRKYVETRTALEDIDMRSVLMKNAISDIQSFQAKYRALTQLAGILDAMEVAKQELMQEVARGQTAHRPAQSSAGLGAG